MALTIKNLIEIQEQDATYGQALIARRRNISKFSTLGPPDLCYLTKVFSKPFGLGKSPPTVGCYHYAYGVDMSSPSCISIYINTLLKSQESEGGWFSKGTWSIKKAVYCVYDAFKKLDIRAEISIPGGMKLSAITKDEQSIAIDGSEWDSVFISAMLRAFNPDKTPFTRFYRELATHEHLKEFLKSIADFAMKQDLRFENDELINYRGNRILYHVSDYLIRKRRLSSALEFFTSMAKMDKRCAAFIVDAFSCMYKYPDSVRLLAPILQKNPHISILLYQEADSLMKAEKYELALRIARTVIQLCPDSFDAWFLLAEIFFYSKNYKEALVALNTCPFYSREHSSDGIFKTKAAHVSTPKAHDLCSTYSQYMFEPDCENYTPTQFNEEIAKLSPEFLEDNERLLGHMKNLPGARFGPNELKAYKLLVKIEREVGWDTLLKIRTSIFIMDIDQSVKSPSKTNDVSQLEDYSIDNDRSQIIERSGVNFVPGLSMNEQSFHVVKLGGEALIDKFREGTETLGSVDNEDLPSFLQDYDAKGGKNYKKLKGPGPDEASRVEDRSYDDEDDDSGSIDSNPRSGNKFSKFMKEENYKSRSTKFNASEIMNLEIRSKRLCSRMLETFFVALHEDLTLLYEWQHEESLDQNILHKENEKAAAEDDEEKIKYGGLVWVHRGILAERLCRISFAEKAYRRVIDKAISLYALARLFKLYIDSGNVKASLLCFGEIIEEMDVDGIKKYEFLPSWLEEPLLQVFSTIGAEKFKAIVKEANLEQEPAILVLLKQAEYWKIENAI